LLPPRASTKPKALAAAASSPTRTADSGERLPTQAELPEPQRQATAGLVISGSVYSADAASRFLIVRGEVVREGAELGPGWALEEIRAREAVFRIGRLRYRQTF
jgi:general secretion pathway protein B